MPDSRPSRPESRPRPPGTGAREAPSSPAASGGRLVLLGEIGRAHGLRGELRIKSYTADPAAIARYGPLVTEDGRRLTLGSVRPAGAQPDMLIARIEGVATREAAEALARTRLLVERERLAAPEDEDEFYIADLVGLAVEDRAGRPAGRVVAVPDFGGGQMLDIAPLSGPTVLVPFTKAFVPEVDIPGGRVVIAAEALSGADEARGEDGSERGAP